MTKKQVLFGSSVLAAMVTGGLLLYLLIIYAGNYAIDEKQFVMDATSTIVDENGEFVTNLFIENRELVSITDIPQHVQDAFVAIEDARFYRHQGIDFKSIARAVYRDVVARAKVEGASTITQQLAKNTFLSNEKTFFRKTKEVLIAMNLERRYSKSTILEMYLNRIYFGHGAYGIEAASKLYFNKSVAELTIDEGAVLAGLPKAPNSYSPINHPAKSVERRNLVLSVMHRQGYLQAEDTVSLQGRVLKLEDGRTGRNDALTTYIDMVLDEAEERFGLSNEEVLRGGYTIIVPIDTHLQEAAFRKLQDDNFFPKGNEDVEAAFIMMDTETGGVLAVQGGRHYVQKGINRVNVKRQPGSVMKPIAVYGPAMEEGMLHPYSMLKDELVDYGGYTPRNYNNQYLGEMSMYDALTKSANAPAVSVLHELGIEKAKGYLEKVQIVIPDSGLSIALGGLSRGVSPLEITKAYRPFASKGEFIEHHFITEMYDRNGERIGRVKKQPKQVFSPQTAWYMTRMLENVVAEGTGSSGVSQQALAGKTGTTSFTEVSGAARDAWFTGYTSNVVGTVWIGYDVTNTEHYLKGGSSYPTVLFKSILAELPKNRYSVSFVKGPDIQELEPPVKLMKIEDLTANVTFGGRGFFGARLTWTPSVDTRVHYHIYEVKDNQMTFVGAVQGKGEYLIGPINLFARRDYVVVPFNPLTEREGSPSNISPVEVKFRF